MPSNHGILLTLNMYKTCNTLMHVHYFHQFRYSHSDPSHVMAYHFEMFFLIFILKYHLAGLLISMSVYCAGLVFLQFVILIILKVQLYSQIAGSMTNEFMKFRAIYYRFGTVFCFKLKLT